MGALTHLECSGCHESFDLRRLSTVCDACGQPLLARYDLAAVARAVRPSDLAGRPATMWRYAEVLPVEDGAAKVSLGETITPLLRAPRLGGGGMKRWAIPLACLAGLAAPAAAPAEVKVLRVADPSGAGHVAAELVPKEIAAVVLEASPGDYPLRVLRATVRVGALGFSLSGHTGYGTMRLRIWKDVGTDVPGDEIYQGPRAVSVAPGENTFDLGGEGIEVASGKIRVGFEVGMEGADVLVDDNGMTAGRNYVLGKQTGTADTFRWQPFPGSLLAGDFLIALEVETAADAGAPASDAGVTADAGAPGPDGGAGSDAGADGGALADGGPAGDAGVTTDGGAVADAGPRDGGVATAAPHGCACDAGARAAGWVPALFALAILRARRWRAALLALVALLAACARPGGAGSRPAPELGGVMEDVKRDLLARHGEKQRERIERAVRQVASLWRSEDGDAAAFANLLRTHFAGDPKALDALFQRFQETMEQVDGLFLEMGRELRRYTEVDRGAMVPLDKLLAGFDPGAHLLEDLFRSKIAFVALANFPLTTLAERLEKGPSWSRRQWAEARLAGRFARRIPASVQQGIAKAAADADLYIAEYNIFMHHLLDGEGKRLFKKGLRLITHWNLRDEIKANYATPDGLPRQRMIARVMERIVTQTIPRVVVNNPAVDWNPESNEVRPAPPETVEEKRPAVAVPLDASPEPDTRYAHILSCFHAVRAADPHSPMAPTHIARKFEIEREIPEARVEAMLKEVLTSPLIGRVAKIIERRLGRPLEPFDIWYDGFRPRGKFPEAELDALVRKRYPTAEAFQADLANLLVGLGFTEERARYLADRIVVDPSRGAGHALEARRRQDKPRLRTRVEKGGMNYKGFNIAIHELGHNVEQVFSLFDVDSTLLQGVPNTAFTEALAFVFQARDLQLLGLEKKADPASERLKTLNELWMTYEIGGVALVDMAIWRWMYANPGATPAELREATLKIARDLWNRYYAPVFGRRDVPLLAIYSHIVSNFLYTPDYPIGHLIAFQIEEHLKKGGNLGREFERMATYGSVTPDLWMRHATGRPVGAAVLLEAAEAAVRAEEGSR